MDARRHLAQAKRVGTHRSRLPSSSEATLPAASVVAPARLEVVARLSAMIVRHALSLLDNPNGPRVEQRLSPAGVRHAAMHPRSARRRRVDRERAADGGDAVAHVRDPRAELRFGRVKPRA